MAEWNLFQFNTPRPELEEPYQRNERPFLEFSTAALVSQLLSEYGTVIPNNKVSPSYHCLEDTYSVLQVEKEPLVEGNSILVGQLPYLNGNVVTAAGYHSIELRDQFDNTELGLTVIDPVKIKARILDIHAEALPFETLTEVHDAMSELLLRSEQTRASNIIPYIPSLFPKLQPRAKRTFCTTHEKVSPWRWPRHNITDFK